MKPQCLCPRVILVTLAGAVILQSAVAAVVEFTIDTSQTHVTLSGQAAGLTLTQQGPGSLITSFAGTVLADLGDQSIAFLGGSHIEGVVNGDWQPKAFGEPGTEPAEFGAQAGGFLISGTGALRDLLLDLESGPALPLAQDEFGADGLLFRFPENAPSAFDYSVSGLINEKGRELLAGYATNQIAGAVGTLTTQDNLQILYIPIEASVKFELISPGDSELTITGQLRATRELSGTPPIVIGQIRVSEGNLVFEWTGAPDATVRIEGTADLASWNTVADVPPGTTSWSIPAGSGAQFFRVVTTP